MKITYFLLLFLLSSISSVTYSGHELILNDAKSTIDGEIVSSTPKNGVSYSNSVLYISESGTFIISGTLNGQISVSVSGVIELVLNGVSITASSNNALIILKAYEMDSSSSMTYEQAKNLNFENAGVKIIIADGTENTIIGGDSSSYDGAIHSQVSILFTGETENNGILNVISTSEGIECKKHILVNGGILKVSAQDDGMNAKKDSLSVIYIKGGKVLVNSGLGSEGDGIDSNGYIIVEGGEVISAAKPNSDSGLDSNNGIYIDGGSVYATGSSMDMAEKTSSFPTMNLIFNSNIAASNTVVIKDSSGNEVISYCANDADFISGTSRQAYKAAIVTHPNFKANSVYHLYVDGVQYGYTSNDEPSPGPGPRPRNLQSTIYTDFTLSSGATYFSGIQKK